MTGLRGGFDEHPGLRQAFAEAVAPPVGEEAELRCPHCGGVAVVKTVRSTGSPDDWVGTDGSAA